MSTNAAFTIQHVGSSEVVETDLTGVDLLNVPLLNKGTAFSEDERDAFLLHGHLPPHVGTLEEQVRRRIQALRGLGSDLERYLFVRTLQDTNETLFYALVTNTSRSSIRSSTRRRSVRRASGSASSLPGRAVCF